MADKFEDVAQATKGAQITFQIEDGRPISGTVDEVDVEARTVTLVQAGKKNLIQFPAEAAEK